jgi:hypothetical protein
LNFVLTPPSSMIPCSFSSTNYFSPQLLPYNG